MHKQVSKNAPCERAAQWRVTEIKDRSGKGRKMGKKTNPVFISGERSVTHCGVHTELHLFSQQHGRAVGGGQQMRRRLGLVMWPASCHSASSYQRQDLSPDQVFLDPKPKHFTPHPAGEKMPGPFTQVPPKLTSCKIQCNYLNQGANGDTVLPTLNYSPLQITFPFGQGPTKVLSCPRIQSGTPRCI